ncbi:adenine deaminase [Rudanella paleaurantiibacter]|uniref:Adenine deaminase n=1 Tax=Rudanella paleaurantiibacter TaxID=2614655 RepID=A0A7J5U0A7_9BACT|nr:adenine deaminase [Rudanella paleaurantiibacter]KAB7731130.1 adenine deaminase [Rudanella paleaurantiibacter]
MTLTANILDLFDQRIYYGSIHIENGRISLIERVGNERPGVPYVLPGFVDAHVHVESSLLTPAQFARLAVVHGTVATVSDPHEIGNVLGVPGVEYMITDGNRVPFKFCFGAPSCVPATPFETAGATISVSDVRQLLGRREIGYLAEMMNFPGVLNEDPDVMAKIALARAFNKPVDGHAPGLRGDDAQRYIDAGIETDHECFTYEEALDKVQRGMNILIREGSAARNFEALHPLLTYYSDRVMFCSDDKHPDTLAEGHIDQLVVRALLKGHNVWNVLRAACLNPVMHYRLPVGLLREGDPADFIVINDMERFRVMHTVINGQVVAENGKTLIPDLRSDHPNQFNCGPIAPESLAVPHEGGSIRVIEALDGQLITNELHVVPTVQHGNIVADPARDLLKLVVVNRYADAPPAVAFIKNFGLKQGAIASSVGHDSHNITAVGCDDESISRAINLIVAEKGGLSAVGGSEEYILPLPVAGLMTDVDGYEVATKYSQLDTFAKQDLGSSLAAPFMTLSFMALLVIPALKLSDKGLFDGSNFRFTKISMA